ncbi:MAG TPA: hypothetical protein VMU50_15280 [Polyangia bacterium]|nr:hypothetical protein [Polyangia bacterium]
MKSQTRITRPVLERSEPRRTWSTLFGASAPGPGGANGTNGATSSGGGGTAPIDAIQRGVEMAYRVSDEYIRQGQAFARALSQPFSPASGTGSAGNGAGALPQLAERLLRYTSELSSMWMDALRMMAGATAQAGGNGFPGAFWSGVERTSPVPPSSPSPPPSPPAAAEPARERVAIRVESKRRTRASLDVHGAIGRSISVSPLRLRGGKARIANVRIQRAGGGALTIVVSVPPRQTAGTYAAELLDSRAKAKVGTIVVRVLR